MDLDEIKRGLRAEIKKRENEQYLTFQCNVRQMCKDVLAKLEEQESEIAEKDKEIQRLENLCESYRIDCDKLAIREANACKEIERDNKHIRHNKFKRCLAIASYWVAVIYQCVDDKHRQSAERHHRKWLELANKFKDKEAK